jgi:hypothetical protein
MNKLLIVYSLPELESIPQKYEICAPGLGLRFQLFGALPLPPWALWAQMIQKQIPPDPPRRTWTIRTQGIQEQALSYNSLFLQTSDHSYETSLEGRAQRADGWI